MSPHLIWINELLNIKPIYIDPAKSNLIMDPRGEPFGCYCKKNYLTYQIKGNLYTYFFLIFITSINLVFIYIVLSV